MWSSFMACNDRDPKMSFTSLGVSEFCEWIEQCDHEFPEAVVNGLRENGLNGSLFLQLSTEELKELAPRIRSLNPRLVYHMLLFLCLL